jgi:hypothetical protein
MAPHGSDLRRNNAITESAAPHATTSTLHRPDGSPDGTPMNRATRRTGGPIERENRPQPAGATDTPEFSLDALLSSYVRNQKRAMNC